MQKILLLFFILSMLCTGFLLFAESSEQELFTEAESFYYSKNYDLAIESYHEFSDKYKQSELFPDVQFRTALCYFYLQQYDDSVAVLEKTERRYRSTRYLQFIPFWIGMNYYHLQKYIPALESFAVYLENKIGNEITEQAVYYKAVCESELEKYPDAEKTITDFLEKYPDSSLFHYGFVLLSFIHFKTENADARIAQYSTEQFLNLPKPLKNKFTLYYADALILKSRITEAKSIYSDLLKESSDVSGVALAKLFSIAMKSKQLQEMEKLIRIADDTFADKPEVLVDFWTNIGIASFSENNMQQAEYYFNRAWGFRNRITIPDSVPLYLSEILTKKGSNEYAAKILQEYLGLFKDKSDNVLFRAGSLSVQAGDYEKAIEYLELHLKEFPFSPNRAKIKYTLSYALYKTKETQKAIVLTTDILADTKQDVSVRQAAVKLHSKLLVQRGEVSQAREFLSSYIKTNTEDLQAQRDYVYILFEEKNYTEVIARVAQINKKIPSLKQKNEALFTVLKYFEGLSYVSLKNYKSALDSLSAISLQKTDDHELKEIAPFVVFYKGWSYYRLGDFNTAATLFIEMMTGYPGHELYERALYYTGWCFYSNSNYQQSKKYFSNLAEKSNDTATKSKARFFLAKSELALGSTSTAESILINIWKNEPDSDFADDALFEYAGILAGKNQTEQAAAAYLNLSNKYPQSTLLEEALYNRAELYYRAGSFQNAKSAFEIYQVKYPAGNLIDASFYWAGSASLQVKNMTDALKHWETLIQTLRNSPFRSEAMKQSAELRLQRKEYEKALNLFQDIIAQYPKEAESMNAKEKASELRYLVMGLSKEEARLTALIDREGKTRTSAGRTAMNDLAALYLKDNDSSKWETALILINQVLTISSDKKTKAQAQYSLAEYYYKKRDYKQAGNEFLNAAFVDTSNQDLMAHSIYRAAEMMKLSGDNKTAGELVDRLIKNFPTSPWTTKGKQLVGGGQ